MTGCRRMADDAAGLAALRPDDPERAAAWAHAGGCAECARALREAERLQALVGAWDPEPLPPAVLAGASRAIGAELRREARLRAVASAAAACAAAAVLVGLARHRSHAAGDWAVAAVLWAVAVLLAAGARGRPALATAAAAVAAIAAVAIAGGVGPLAPVLGIECLVSELASGAAVVGAAWLALRGGTTSPARSAMAAAAAAGALAGYAALQVTCAAHAAIPHLLAFHVGGVLLAAGGAALLWRTPRPVHGFGGEAR